MTFMIVVYMSMAVSGSINSAIDLSMEMLRCHKSTSRSAARVASSIGEVGIA
jgi:hypothetical protein